MRKTAIEWETLKKLIETNNQKLRMQHSMSTQLWLEPFLKEQPNLFSDLNNLIAGQAAVAKEKMPVVSKQNVVEQIRQTLSIEPLYDEKTIVILVVTDEEDKEKNIPQHICCPDGICLSGYVKDVPKDSYIAECIDYIALGTIPVAFGISMPNAGGWRMKVPMPEIVIEKLSASYYKRMLKEIRQRFPKPKYAFHYMQMLSCG